MSSMDHITTQKEEIKALRNIFGKEFRLHRPKNINKKYEPPHISVLINVGISSNNVTEFSVKIHFDCAIDYPLSCPKLSLSDTVNIPTAIREELITVLTKKCSELKGNQMIYHLVDEAREMLVSKLDRQKSANVISHPNYDDIIQKEKVKLNLLRQRHNFAKNESTQAKKIEKCFHTYQQNSNVIECYYSPDKNVMQLYKGICEGNHRVKLINNNLQLIFNTFQGFNLTKGLNAKIHQISLSSVTQKRLEHLKSDWLEKLEKDFSILYTLDHPNLLPYVAYRSHIHDKQIRKKKYFDININYVTQSCSGVKLSKMCEIDVQSEPGGMKPRLPITKIRGYLKSVMSAVRYLHERQITFVKLNMDSILIDENFELKLCHYYIGKRFEELKEKYRKEFAEDTTESTDTVRSKKGSTKYDILKVGKLAKQLFFFGVPELEINETEMPLDLIDFIHCSESYPDELHLHSFLYPDNKKKSFPDEISNFNQDLSPWKLFQQSSRIPREFELISKLGEGAFGDVVKVKNIYDNQFYAIKRVRLNSIPKKAARTMKEVQLLSSLNHENIVRYYASWSEEIVKNSAEQNLSQNHYVNATSSSIRVNISDNKSIHKLEHVNSALLEMQDTKNSMLFTSSLHRPSNFAGNHHFDIESYSDSETDTELEQSSIGENEMNPVSAQIVFCNSTSISDEKKSVKHSKRSYLNDQRSVAMPIKSKIDKFLMIQMELCEGMCNTLQKYIETQKLYLNKRLIWRFIREIVSGLDHIHSKNMIHRDLKPNNIFLDLQRRIKIGDLGLGMNFIQRSPNDPASNQSAGLEENQFPNEVERGPVGTALYISPEMMSNSFYTNKVDMYSLGIIIFEMCFKPFQTTSERFIVLNRLRLPQIIYPNEKELKIDLPFKHIINSLLIHDHTKRPSASELLKSNIIPPPEGKELEFRQFLIQLTKTSNSSLYKLMLKELFQQTSTESRQYELPVLYQSPFKYFLSNTRSPITQILSEDRLDEGDYTYFILKRDVLRHLESVFVSHCAVEFTAPLLSPNVTKHGTDKLFTLLDCEGVVISLPDNLRVNFADFLLNNNITSTRRFAIGPIYQHQEYRRDHPRELIEAAFDIVTDYHSINKSIEVLIILNQILKKFFKIEHISLILEINHTDLFDGLMDYYKIPKELCQKLRSSPFQNQTLSDIDYLDSDEFRESSKLPEIHLVNLKNILRFNDGSLDGFEKLLKQFLNRTSDLKSFDVIMIALNELRTMEQHFNNCLANPCFAIQIRPKFVPVDSIYRGFVFQLMLYIHDRLFDCVNYSNKKQAKFLMKYLRNPKTLGNGGDYSRYFLSAQSPAVTENGDTNTALPVSAVGVSIDVSTVLQCLYSIRQLCLINGDFESRPESIVVNGIVTALVQYDADNDLNCRELMTALWTAGISAQLYDLDGNGEDFAFNRKINFFVKFLPKNDKKSSSVVNSRIFITKNSDYKGVGVELDDSAKVVEFISRELSRLKETCVLRSEKDKFQRQRSDSASLESSMEIDLKKMMNTNKTETTMASRYLYKFINVKDGKISASRDLCLSYFVETQKHMQSLIQKHVDIDNSQIKIVAKLNCHLSNLNRWLQGRFPNPLFCIVAELSSAKCRLLLEEVNLKSLKDPNKVMKILNKVESAKIYSSNVNGEKQWKDILPRIWEAMQIAVKEKIFKIVLYSHVDDRIEFVEIK